MKRLIFVFTCMTLLFCQAKAVEDTTYTIGDSAQVQVVDSVETDPGLMMDSIFRNLDAQYMSTNLLADRSIAFIDYRSYHGRLTNSNWMTYSKLLRLNGAMLMAIHDTPVQYTLTDTIKHWYHHYDSLGYKPFALFNMQYNELKDSALTDNLVQKNGIQLEDVPGRSENPYLTRRAFGGSFQTRYIKGASYQFIIPQELYLTNTGETLDSLLVDFENGNGFQQVALDSVHSVPIPSGVDTSTVVVKAVFANDSTFKTHTRIITENYSGAMYEDASDFDTVFSAVDPSNDEPHDGGTVQVAYGCSNEEITRPLIVVEGFNPEQWGDLEYINFEEQLSGVDNLYNNLELNSYDIIYVDYNNSLDHIQHNAELVEDVIQWVNQKKAANGSDYQNVVLGRSMGGLVSRWALHEMENTSGLNHDTRLYVSHDAPHRGVNLPVSAQAMMRHIAGVQFENPLLGIDLELVEKIPRLKRQLEVLNSKPARQMIRYYVNDLSFDQDSDQQFFDNYENISLNNCREVAVSNGSELGQNGGQPFGPGSDLVTVDEGIFIPSWMGYVGVGLTTVTGNPLFLTLLLENGADTEFNLRALPDGGSEFTVYSGEIQLHVAGMTIDITNKEMNVWGVDPWDSGPGGIRALDEFADFNPNQLPDFVNLHEEQFCFVPTVSALDVNNFLDDPYFDVQNVSNTSFNNYFARTQTQNENELHVAFSAQNEDFFIDEIVGEDQVNSFLTQITTASHNLGENTSADFQTTSNVTGITVDNDRTLYINEDKPLGPDGSSNPHPSSNSTFNAYLTADDCGGNALMEVNDDGTLEIGNPANPHNKGNFILTDGSTLILGDQGNLIVHEGSKLIVREGATFTYENGAHITLNGAGAEIVVKGDMIIGNDATFSFASGPQGHGRIVFASSNWPANNLIYENDAEFNLNGNGEHDVLLEVKQDNLFASDRGGWAAPDIFRINEGKVLMHEGARLMVSCPNFILTDVHMQAVNGKSHYDSDVSHRGIEIWPTDLSNNINISLCKIEDADDGVLIHLTHLSEKPEFSIAANRIQDCKNGVDTRNGAINITGILKDNVIGWNAEGMEMTSEFYGEISGSQTGIDFRSSGNANLRINKNTLIDSNFTGIKFTGNKLEAFCCEIVNNVTGINVTNGKLGASQSNQPYIGYVDFRGNGYIGPVILTPGKIALNNGHNIFMDNTINIEGYAYQQGYVPPVIEANKNYWGPGGVNPVDGTHYDYEFSYPPSSSVGVTFDDPNPIENLGEEECPQEPLLSEWEFDGKVPPDIENEMPEITTEDFIDVNYDDAVNVTVTGLYKDSSANKFIDVVDRFYQICTHPVQSSNDPVQRYINYYEDLAYEHMMEAAGRGVASGQINVTEGGEIPASLNKIIEVQNRYIDSAIADGSDSVYRTRLKYTLDKATTYLLAKKRQSALTTLNGMDSWVDSGQDQERVDYWRCVTNYRIGIHNGTISTDSARYQYNCSYPHIDSMQPILTKRHIGNTQSDFNRKNKTEYFNVFPNPNKGKFRIDFKLNAEQSIGVVLFDLNGRPVRKPISSQMFSKGKHRINVNANRLSAGTYLLEMHKGKKVNREWITIVQ